MQRPTSCTLFPYTTRFRSTTAARQRSAGGWHTRGAPRSAPARPSRGSKRSPGRSRTYVACPDSKSGGPCRQTNRGSATGSGAYAMGHREDPAEGQHGAVRGGGVRRTEPPAELGLELLSEPLGKGDRKSTRLNSSHAK